MQEEHNRDYGRRVESLGCTVVRRGPWASVGTAARVQGWKLHLSSVPVEAVVLLDTVVPCLRADSVAFKVANDVQVLSQLNEGRLGPTQIGKFMTIYPHSDDEARDIALELMALTAAFHGPVIATDRRLGAIVYTRYGGFNPVVLHNRLGLFMTAIYAPDGSLRSDAYRVPFVPPEGVADPFAGIEYAPGGVPAVEASAAANRLLGPGYLILDIIRPDAKGAVLRALDLRSQDTVALKVIKQGRQYCYADVYGRDIRTRLQRQAQLHARLEGIIPIPQADPYFEHAGDGYLPLAYIEGRTVEQVAHAALANRSWASLADAQQERLLGYLAQLVIAVQALHAAGYVHHDLTASNVWIGEDGCVYLLDLELAHRVGDPVPAFGMGTLGFVSPDQLARRPPAFADDVYAIGCVMVLVLTGLDPRRVLFGGEERCAERLAVVARGSPPALLANIAACLSPDAAARPALADVLAVLRGVLQAGRRTAPQAAGNSPAAQAAEPGPNAAQLVAQGIQGILTQTIVDEEGSGLWLSAADGRAHAGSAGVGAYTLQPDANHGVAGVVYLLGRLARAGWTSQAVRTRVEQAAAWLLSQPLGPDDLPGLHFGRAGTAVALCEALAGGLLPREPATERYITAALLGRLDWPDITHGAAGQGVAALYCADRLGAPALLGAAHGCAGYLVDTQQPDGSWKMPPGVEGMSGETLTGFAHGVAGMVYFLAEYDRRFSGGGAHAAWRRGAAWLLEAAIPTRGGEVLEWQYSDQNPVHWHWWCHGGPGIALTLLRLYEQSGEDHFARAAERALREHPVDGRYGNLSQCHGLSGLGEIYLEAARVLGGSEWQHRAAAVADLLFALRRDEGGAVTWLVEDPQAVTADLMVGTSGVVHFFARLSGLSGTLGFPLLLDPLRR